MNKRSEEKTREYGPFSLSITKTAALASQICAKEISPHDVFIVMIALKLSRQSWKMKDDNLIDAVAYIGAWQNYIDSERESEAAQCVSQELEM